MTIVNAAPMVINQGTRDLSTRVIPNEALGIPQHLPKIYLFAEKGPMGPNYMDLDVASLTQIYGDDTFDVNKKYHTRQTLFLQAIAAAGNNCVIHRLSADDAKDVANLALYLDVLPAQVPVYEKAEDGSLVLDNNGFPVSKLDSNGDPILINGHKVGWVVDKTVAPVGQYQRGLLQMRNGLQVDGSVQSTQYPIFEFAAKDAGEFGNKLAVRLYSALESDLTPFPTNYMAEGNMYPFYFEMVQLKDANSGKTAPVLNGFGAQTATFVTKAKGTDPSSGAIIDMPKVLKDLYIDLTPDLATGLGTAYVYQNNLDTVLEMLYESEKNISDSHRDSNINNAADNFHALNIISFTSSNGSAYQSIKLTDFAGSTRLTRYTNLFLSGSTDGTINEALMDRLVAEDMDNYNNPLHEYNDIVLHPESIIYDSGFSVATKKSLAKFIARRKDTFVVVSTFAYNAPAATLYEQYSVGIALKTIFELYPESATFGTHVMRAMIVGGAGELINSLYVNRVPLTYEVAYMAARYMGAKNGAWKNGFCFDRAPRSNVTQLKNIDVTWVPTSTRNSLWAVGVNFVLNREVRAQFFPAMKTIYNDDTSVLNSFFTAVAISYLNKIAHAAWREFTGSISLTDAQLEEQVNLFVSKMVKDKFDNKFVIVPKAKVTELDALRGYSWHLPIEIYANNMKTVMTTNVDAYRMSDYAG